MNRKSLIVIICFVLMAGDLAGCKSTAQKPQAPGQNITQTENLDVSASERRVLANQLSKAAEEINDVQKASVVVANMGGDGAKSSSLVAMVGLTVNAGVKADEGRLAAVKQAVVERLKKVDNRIEQVLVTTDPTMIKKINDIAAGIIEGKPIQTYQKDVNSLNNELKKERGRD